MTDMYKNDINGLGGNDDCGQMSAWYLFSVMGFYTVCPGTDQYVLLSLIHISDAFQWGVFHPGGDVLYNAYLPCDMLLNSYVYLL